MGMLVSQKVCVAPCLSSIDANMTIPRFADAGAAAVRAFQGITLRCLVMQVTVPALFVEDVVAGQAVHDVIVLEVLQAYRALVVRAQVLRDGLLSFSSTHRRMGRAAVVFAFALSFIMSLCAGPYCFLLQMMDLREVG